MVSDVFEDGRCIYIGQVDGSMMSLRQQLRELAMQSKKPITLIISSPGGSVLGGNAFMDEMDAVKKAGIKLIGFVQGQAMSMGLSILMNCTHRVAGSNAILMAHGSSGGSVGDLKDRKAMEKFAQIMHDRMAYVYSRRTEKVDGGLTYDQWVELFEEDTPHFFTAQEALDAGLIDEILEDVDDNTAEGN